MPISRDCFIEPTKDMQPDQPTIFVSYSRGDEREKEALLTHLGGLERQGLIRAWHDDQIEVGMNWEESIHTAIGQAKIAILVVTANFLNSDFIINQEIPRLLARQSAGELIIMPVIAKPCAWATVSWLAEMQIRPKGGRPIWRDGGKYADEELTSLTHEIIEIIQITVQPTHLSAGVDVAREMLAQYNPNPFGDKGRITDPKRFFGRQELMRQIFEELNKGANLSLVGESQIGKSSILSMVCALGPNHIDLAPEQFAYLSLEWVDDEDDFYEALCDALGLETARGFRFTRALRGKRYLLCLDEIEKMTWDGFTVRVRSHLRGLADGHDAPLTLVIASRSPLERLFPDSPEMNSPLAGICRQFDVKPFSPDVARAFIDHRLQDTGVSFTESQIQALITESQGYPARLQQAAANLYRKLTTEE